MSILMAPNIRLPVLAFTTSKIKFSAPVFGVEVLKLKWPNSGKNLSFISEGVS